MKSPGRSAVIGPVLAVAAAAFPGACARSETLLDPGEGRPRVIVLTDISNEPDDEESLVRFLVSSNEFDVEGLVATTSVWLRDRVRPDLLRRSVEAYGKVRQNLLLHAPGFPAAESLLAVVKAGRPEFGMAGVGEGKDSEGSRHIVDVVDRKDPRPVWALAWGGPNCLAQALWSVRAARTPAELDAFTAKIRVYAISDQDDSGHWIRASFPSLHFIVSPSTVDEKEYHRATWTGISGDQLYRNCPGADFSLVENSWLEENVRKGHGPLGELYPPYAYIMEGDTPSFLGLIGNGLGWKESPAFGGWGGRYALRKSYGEARPIWTNARDTVTGADGKEFTSDQATVWRWREAYQHDFGARMDWCVRPRAGANHHPTVVVNGSAGKGILRLEARPGETMFLDAAGTADPDGDALSYRWFSYREAGTFEGKVEIDGGGTARASFRAPPEKEPRTIHVILEVKDAGAPCLHAYRRAIVTVRP